MEFTLLSRLDDFLCDTFLDCFYLWFSTIKMNKNHRQPKLHSAQLADIVYRHVICANDLSGAINEILAIPFVVEFRANMTETEEIEFSNHMKRYLCMYLPAAGYEVSDTSRYGGVEARAIATKNWYAGDEIKHCTGVITCLDPEQDRMLKTQNRDFSVMWSTRKNSSCLFLGPARFLNHDCESNTKFMPFGESGITFKVVRDIKCGEEITTFYGEHYFGENNSECLCVSCEKRGEGAFSKTRKASGFAPTGIIADSSHDSQRRSSRRRKKQSYENFFNQSGVPRRPRKSERVGPTKRPTYSSIGSEDENSAPSKPRVMDIDFLCNPVEHPQEDIYPVSGLRYQAQSQDDMGLFQVLCEISSQQPYYYPYYYSYIPPRPASVYNYPVNPYEKKIPDNCATCQRSMVGRLDEWLKNPRSRLGEWPPTRCSRCDRHWLIFRRQWPTRKAKKKQTKRVLKALNQSVKQLEENSEDEQWMDSSELLESIQQSL